MDFLYENVLYFMFLPALILLFFIIKKQEKIQEYFSEEMLKKLSLKNRYLSNKARNIILVLSLVFMIIALSRPVTNIKVQSLHSFTIDLNSTKQVVQTQVKTYTELFYYPLALGLLLLFIALFSPPSFKKKSSSNSAKTVLLLVFIFILNKQTNASILDFIHIKKGNENYQNENYKKAYNNFNKIENSPEKFYNLANSLYKQKKYTQAINNYTKIKTQNRDLNFNKYHNLGNAHAMKGMYQKAILNYEKALKIKNEKKTKQNLQKVKNILANKPK